MSTGTGSATGTSGSSSPAGTSGSGGTSGTSGSGGTSGTSGSSGRASRAAQAARDAAQKGANATKSAASKYLTKGTAKALGKFAVKRAIPVVGTALLVTDVADAIRGQKPILHHQPEPGRTKYLPVARNGNMDDPHNDHTNSVDSLDAHIDEINEQSFRFEPSTVCSYCPHGCDEGCHEVTANSSELSADTAVTPLENWSDQVNNILSVLRIHAGEMWADRLLEVYGPDGPASLLDLSDRTDTVMQALSEAVRTSDAMGDHAFKALRASITWGRDEMQKRVDDENSTFGWLGDFFTNSRGNHALDHLKEETAKVDAAAKENDVAVARLNEALDAWTFTGALESAAHPKGDNPRTPHPPIDEQTRPNPEPGTPGKTPPEDKGNVEGGTPTPPAAPTTDDPNKSLADKLDELMNRQSPDMGMPPGMGMPGGGMPGGMGMPDFGQGMGQSPFGQDLPMSAEASDDYLHPEKDDDVGDDESADGGGNLNNLGADEPTPDDDTPPDDGGVAPVDAGVPSAQPAAFDPNSEAARTVDMGEGRMVTFPSAHMADTMRAMVSSDPGNPKSLYMAASESGYTLPPQGEDIGRPVEPSTMRVGDVISADGKYGVYLGDGDVRMEDSASPQKLADVASRMDGEHQGIFRLTEPDSSGGSTPVQTVSDVHPTPQEVPVSTPGVPTDDAPVVGSTSESTANAPGLSMSATALDPNSAFGQ